MNDRAKILLETEEAFGGLRQATAGLTEEKMLEVWLGTWSVREILIHISGWHRVMIPALERVGRGEAPYPPGAYDDFDAWNARFVAEKTGVKLAVTAMLAVTLVSVRAAVSTPSLQLAKM